MNINGVPEMIRDAGRSRYVTPQYPWWASFLLGLSLGFLIGVVLCVTSAHASPSCMTFHEARQAYPHKHIRWHPSDGGRCWGDMQGRIRIASKPENRLSQQDLAIVAPDQPEDVWPSVIHLTMIGTTFTDRWPETSTAISPLRWSNELIEFGNQ